MFQKILERIVEQSIPARLPDPWGFLGHVPNVRVLDGDPAAIVALLLSEFPQDELESARIVLPTSETELRLTPVVAPKAPFRVLSASKDGVPIDLESGQGRLIAGDPPAFRTLNNYLTCKRRAGRNWVLATWSDNDLALLEMLQLPVTSACGLDKATAAQARRFLVPGNFQSSRQNPKLILVGAKLFELRNELPPELLRAAAQFERIERSMKLDTTPNIGVWLPSESDFRHIVDGVRLADRRLVYDAIGTSVHRSTKSIKEFVNVTSRPQADDLLAARSRLVTAVKDMPKSLLGNLAVPARLKDYSLAYDIAIIQRIQHDAAVAEDALCKALLTVAAELMVMQFDSSEVVQRAKALVEGSSAYVETPIEERLNFQVRLVNALVKIRRAVDGKNTVLVIS